MQWDNIIPIVGIGLKVLFGYMLYWNASKYLNKRQSIYWGIGGFLSIIIFGGIWLLYKRYKNLKPISTVNTTYGTET